jgi:type IV secretory pathway VirB2 component (pilin)
MPFFVALVAVAVALQAILLAAIYFQLRATARRVDQVTQQLQERVYPLISKVQMIVEDVHPRISTMFTEAAEITHLAKVQVQRADRLFTEAADRLRLQLVHVDQILTGALGTVEDASTKIRRSFLGPLQSIVAVVRGVQTGIDFYRGVRRPPPAEAPAEQQDETLFI